MRRSEVSCLLSSAGLYRMTRDARPIDLRQPPLCGGALKALLWGADPASHQRAQDRIESLHKLFRDHGAASFELHAVDAASACALVAEGAVRRFAAEVGRMPHVVTSCYERLSTLQMLRTLRRDRQCLLTILHTPPGEAVTVDQVQKVLRVNTCLVMIAAHDRDSGAASPLAAIGALLQERRVPFHVDAEYLFRHRLLDVAQEPCDSFSIPGPQLGLPHPIGLLAIRRAFREGYRLPLPGWVTPPPILVTLQEALRCAHEERGKKDQTLREQTTSLAERLAERVESLQVVTDPAEAVPGLLLLGLPGQDAAQCCALLKRRGFVAEPMPVDRPAPQDLKGAPTEQGRYADPHCLVRLQLPDDLPEPTLKKLYQALRRAFRGDGRTAAGRPEKPTAAAPAAP